MSGASEAIGPRVQKFREKLGWSQSQFAELAGTTQQTVDRIERGKTLHSRAIPKLEQIMASFGNPATSPHRCDHPGRAAIDRATRGDAVMDYITGADTGELARTKAEAAYTSAALGREIDLHRESEAELERVRSAIRDLRSECFSGPAVDKDAVWAACLKLFAAALTQEEVRP